MDEFYSKQEVWVDGQKAVIVHPGYLVEFEHGGQQYSRTRHIIARYPHAKFKPGDEVVDNASDGYTDANGRNAQGHVINVRPIEHTNGRDYEVFVRFSNDTFNTSSIRVYPQSQLDSANHTL